MKNFEVFLFDEDLMQRTTSAAALNALFDRTGVTIVPKEPLSHLANYPEFLTSNAVSGLILDQDLANGGFTYLGTDLASFIRKIDAKVPIIILTNYVNEGRFEDAYRKTEKDIEYLVSKEDISDPGSLKAQAIKARLLRHLNVFAEVLDERENRFHKLLVKSMKERLSASEIEEMGILRQERLRKIQAAELGKSADLQDLLNKLREVMNRIED